MHDTATHYSRTAISLHWLVAAAIAATFSLGVYMHELPFSPEKLRLYSWHKWAGVTIFLLVVLRLLWRMRHPVPAPVAGMPRWQQRVAGAMHALLYLLMVMVPLSGWLMSSAKGVQTVWFGVLPLPDLLGKDKELGELLETVHKSLNFSMAGLVLAHTGAALKHHLVDRDEVLARMLPFFGKPKSIGDRK